MINRNFTMNELKVIGHRINGNWLEATYDIQYRYGYETMLEVLDSVSEEYGVRIEIVDKAILAGAATERIWQKTLFRRSKPLIKMRSLKEECGIVSIGGKCKVLSLRQVYITMVNQTSMITIQILKDKESETGQESMKILASAIQAKVASQY